MFVVSLKCISHDDVSSLRLTPVCLYRLKNYKRNRLHHKGTDVQRSYKNDKNLSHSLIHCYLTVLNDYYLYDSKNVAFDLFTLNLR